MNDPERLLDGGSDAMRTLLSSASADDPSDAELRDLGTRMAPLIGAPPVTSPPAATGAAVAKTGLAMKGLAVLAVVTTIAGGAVVARRYALAPKTEGAATSATVAPPEPSVAPAEGSAAAPGTSAAPAESSLPSATAAVPSPAASVDPSLEPELVKRAQSQLAGGNAAGALDLTQQHARLFPGGAHAEERERIAIEALVRVGRADEARARAERFLARYPRSVYRPRLESLVGKRR